MSRINQKLIYPRLSYKTTGILFQVHNELGRYAKEKQYQDLLERKLNDGELHFEREKKLLINAEIGGNQVDFCVDNKILIECKAKRFLLKDDYYQMLRYLKASKLKLGFIVNFRNRYLKPKRVLNPDVKVNNSCHSSRVIRERVEP